MKRRTGLLLLVPTLTLAITVLTGCPPTPFIRRGETAPQFPANATGQIILSVAQQRLCSVRSLRVSGVDVVYRSPKEKLACDAVILLRAPVAARVIGTKIAAGTIFDLLALDGIVRNYVPSDKTVYVYLLAENPNGAVATVPWGLIMGVRACPADGLALREAAAPGNSSDIRLEGASPDGALQEVFQFDRKTLLLKTHQIVRASDGAAVTADYAEWALIQGIWWPLRVVIHLPLKPESGEKASEATIEISQRISKVKLNTEIPDALFSVEALDIPPGTKEEVVEPRE